MDWLLKLLTLWWAQGWISVKYFSSLRSSLSSLKLWSSEDASSFKIYIAKLILCVCTLPLQHPVFRYLNAIIVVKVSKHSVTSTTTSMLWLNELVPLKHCLQRRASSFQMRDETNYMFNVTLMWLPYVYDTTYSQLHVPLMKHLLVFMPVFLFPRRNVFVFTGT